jgi:hypothetical protein
MATKASKKEDGLLSYEPKEGVDGITRAVEYLVWASKNFPKRPVPLNYIVKFALNEPKIPKEESLDVANFRDSKLRRVRDKLTKDYKRGLVYHPGMGYRSTVDADDIVENVMEKKRKRVQSAISSLSETESIVDRDSIKASRVRNRFEELSDATRRLNHPAIRDRLAAPIEDEDE